ncbi:MAG: hypothetical protein SGI77_14600 [Pirellulaceae bacterium]|nr:hypothetical protein [Pirellulaceae bacterium]
MLANANTKLASNDVFYFGNAIGDVGQGNSGTPTLVRTDDTDWVSVRQNLSPNANSVPFSNVFDVNKDGQVNPIDMSLVRQNSALSVILFFTAPVSFQLAATTSTSPALLSGGFTAESHRLSRRIHPLAELMKISECEPMRLATGSEYTNFSAKSRTAEPAASAVPLTFSCGRH